MTHNKAASRPGSGFVYRAKENLGKNDIHAELCGGSANIGRRLGIGDETGERVEACEVVVAVRRKLARLGDDIGTFAVRDNRGLVQSVVNVVGGDAVGLDIDADGARVVGDESGDGMIDRLLRGCPVPVTNEVARS